MTTAGASTSQALTATTALFAPSATAALGARVAAVLGTSLSAHEEREFAGGEHKMRSLESVRRRSVYVIQSLWGDAAGSANDRLCRLLFFIGALKDAGALRVTACLPYLAYARKDRRTKARDPVTSRYVAQILEAVGADRVVTADVHNLAAFDNAFRCESVHLEATDIFVRRFAADRDETDRIVVSPDIGGIKRARHFQEFLERAMSRAVGIGFMDKKRSEGVVSGDTLVGAVKGKHVILIDDLISSGTTILRAVDACRRAGATRIDVAATHATFTPEAHRLFGPSGPDSVIVTDSVALHGSYSPYLNRRLEVLEIAPLFAAAIRRLELGGGSLSQLGGLVADS
jgi:ribose-phosphate pyrophosphokinase